MITICHLDPKASFNEHHDNVPLRQSVTWNPSFIYSRRSIQSQAYYFQLQLNDVLMAICLDEEMLYLSDALSLPLDRLPRQTLLSQLSIFHY